MNSASPRQNGKSEPQLPLPMPADWMTVSAAAHHMRVHRRTIERLIGKRVLTPYSPWAAPNETPPVMLWRDEVLQVHAARQKLAAASAGR